jgi:hypothetical protein
MIAGDAWVGSSHDGEGGLPLELILDVEEWQQCFGFPAHTSIISRRFRFAQLWVILPSRE